MKKLICLLVAFLLMGCTFGQTAPVDEEAQMKEKLNNRREYLEEALDEQLNKKYPDGYDIIGRRSENHIEIGDDIKTTDTVSRLIRIHKTNELTAVSFGNNNSNTLGAESEDKFFDYLDDRDRVRQLAEEKYPFITENYPYLVWGTSTIHPDKIGMYIALMEKDLGDKQLMEALAAVFQQDDSIAVLKIDGTEDKEWIEMYLMSYYAGTFEEFRTDKGNPPCEDYIEITVGCPYSYSDCDFEQGSDVTAEKLEEILRREWNRNC